MRLWRSLPIHRIAVILSVGLALSFDRLSPLADPEITATDDTVKVDKSTEAVINGSLKYLASQQMPDGSWTGDKNNPASNKYAVAMTSYVMMAFLANGNLPDAGPYAKQVKNGMQFLLDSVQADGTFAETDRSHYMYSHGLGTMVLGEIYGETQSPLIRGKLEHLVLLIVHGQNPEGFRCDDFCRYPSFISFVTTY